MPTGFGIIDYIVVAVVAGMSVYLLAKSPHRMLLWLPTFLTIDFFIPLATQLTPSRFVPLILGAWLILFGHFKLRAVHVLPVFCFLLTLGLSLLYALYIGDAGIRPAFRAMHYLSLLFVFVFITRMLRNDEQVELAIWGIYLAGILHAGYSIYQLFAAWVGLPFRGIVYSGAGKGIAITTAVGIRVNGLADEPKRLGYVLFVAAIAAIYFALRRDFPPIVIPFRRLASWFRNRKILLSTSVGCFFVSLFTYSLSYIGAAAILVIILVLTLSFRALAALVVGGFILLFVATLFPEKFGSYKFELIDFANARIEELSRGLTANTVYRQEMFALDYVMEEPKALVFGLGIGRYNRVLATQYGPIAGYTPNGDIMPINSQLFELGFDLGIVAIIMFYIGGIYIVIRLGRRTLRDYCVGIMLLFLIVQSIFIEDKLVLVFVAALGSAMLAQRTANVRAKSRIVPYPNAAKRVNWSVLPASSQRVRKNERVAPHEGLFSSH